METGVNEKLDIIDLCTPNLDIDESVGIKNTVASTINVESYAHLESRLSILPLYPTSDKYDHGYPLLPNIPRTFTV